MTTSTSLWTQVKSSTRDQTMWFFSTTVLLALWHGILTSRIDSDELTTTIFFWLVALYIIWKMRNELTLASITWKNWLGAFILGFILYRGLLLFWYESFLVQFFPFFTFLGLVIFALSWKKYQQYIRPLLVFFIFSLSDFLIGFLNQLLEKKLNFQQITADFSAFLLHYLGFEVAQQDIIISLPKASVTVGYACTGGKLIAFLIPLSLVLFIAMPLNWRSRFKLILGIIGVGFFLGIARVALLAVVVSDQSTFDYWHGDEGNQIFSLIAFSAWIMMANFIYEGYESQLKSDSQEEEEDNSSENNDFEPVKNNTSSTKQLWFLPGVSIVVGVVTLGTFLLPQIGRREHSLPNFPSQLMLTNWEQQRSVPLTPDEEEAELFERFRSGQEYQYRQGNTEIGVQLRLIEGTLGHVPRYIKTYTSLEVFAERLTFEEGRIGSIEGIGNYQLFADETKAYLSACLTSQGESTVEGNNFVSKMNRNLLAGRALSGIVGQTSLRERRCLWVHLYTPREQASPEAAYDVLESVFKEGYSRWQSLL